MRMPFGKYKGQHVEDIADEDPSYLMAVGNADSLDEELREAINHALEATAAFASAELRRRCGNW